MYNSGMFRFAFLVGLAVTVNAVAAQIAAAAAPVPVDIDTAAQLYQAAEIREQVRASLGSMPAQIRTMMLKQGMRLLGAGLVLGFVGAIALSRVIRSLLFGVSANDPLIYGTVTLVLAAAALFACWIPARRASRVNPMITLRAE